MPKTTWAAPFWPDDTASANYNEVRMWNGALSSNILEILHDAGPNANLDSLNYGGPGSLPSTNRRKHHRQRCNARSEQLQPDHRLAVRRGRQLGASRFRNTYH